MRKKVTDLLNTEQKIPGIQERLSDLEQKLINEEDPDELNNIIDLFNINLQKKNIIRSAKLSAVQDEVVERMSERLKYSAAEMSDDALVKYHRAIQDTISKTDISAENMKIPAIQINQQVNADIISLDSDSRKRILSAVSALLQNKSEGD